MKPAIPIYITAGGRSSRFGSDKARALLDGRPLLSRIAAAVEPVASSVTVVAGRADQYADLGLRTIADLNPGGGPMAGLQTALHDCDQPWLALLSCDLAAVRPAWIETLLAARSDQASIIAFHHTFWEPLIALYHQRLRPQVDDWLAAGRLRMQALLDECGAVAVALPADWPAVAQVNTAADLAAAGGAMGMTIDVLLFGPAAEAAQTGRLPVPVEGGAVTCAELRQRLATLVPALERLLPASRFAVNHAFVADSHVVRPTDEVALIGLVSGG